MLCTCHNHIAVNVSRVNRIDPTHTTPIVSRWAKENKSRWNALKLAIRKKIVDEDCFGLKPVEHDILKMVSNKRDYVFETSAKKVESFMEWLKRMEERSILTTSKGHPVTKAGQGLWSETYVDSAFREGIRRAEQELTPYPKQKKFIQAGMGGPMHADALGLVYTRNFSSLKSGLAQYENTLSQELALGLAEGRNPREMARSLEERTDVSRDKCLVTARTETIRAFHVAQINTYRQAGVEGVKMRAEWLATDDDRVCPKCEELQGKVFTLDEIEPMIPLHPNCRCTSIPYFAEGEEAAPDSSDMEEEEDTVEDQQPQEEEASIKEDVEQTDEEVSDTFEQKLKDEKQALLDSLAPIQTTGTEEEITADRFRHSSEARKLMEMPDEVKGSLIRLHKILGDSLEVHAFHYSRTQKTIAELDLVPGKVLKKLKAEGVKWDVDANAVPKFKGMEHLSGQHPRGYAEGAVWDDVYGAYDTKSKRVIAGGASGSISTPLHETGHAIGDMYDETIRDRPNNSLDLVKHHTRLFDKLSKYEQQGGPGGQAGMGEMFAESVAHYYKDGKKDFTNRYDSSYHNWLKSILK